MKGTRIFATGEQAERLIDELGGSAAEHPVFSHYFTGEQMERAIAAAGGSTAEHPVFSKYATGEQMERLIAALGGDPAEHPVQSKYATAEQAERLILALGGEPAEYPVDSKYMTAEQMERLIPLAGGDPLTTFGPDALVQFTAKKAKAMTEVVVDIEPVQDLHGYDNPWPAGGNKNLYELKADNVLVIDGSVTIGTDNIQMPANKRTVLILCAVSGSTTYTFHVARSGGAIGCTTYDYSAKPESLTDNQISQLDTVSSVGTAKYITVTTSATAAYLGFYFTKASGTSAVTLSQLSVCQGSDQIWMPYANVCPINGWTGAKVFRNSGRNLIPLPDGFYTTAYSHQNVDNQELISALQNNLIPGHSYRYWCEFTYESTGDVAQAGSNDAIQIVVGGTNYTMRKTTTMVMPYGTITKLNIISGASGVSGKRIFSKLFVCEVFDSTELTADDYEPYTPMTIFPVSWSDEAGTVYGGTLTINEDGSGSLAVNYVKYTITSNTAWSSTPTGVTQYFKPSGMKGGTFYTDSLAKCDALAKVNNGSSGPGIKIGSNDKSVYFYNLDQVDPSITSGAGTRQWLIDNAVSFTYPLANPTYYFLTDVGQLSTVVGLNNVWADTGDVTVTAHGSAIVEPDEEPGRALNLLLGNSYSRSGDDPTNEEALDIILGGNTR